MRFAWPWKREQPPAAPIVDVEAIQRAAEQRGREAALAEVKDGLERLNKAAAAPNSAWAGPWARGPVPGAFAYDNPWPFVTPQAPTRRPGQVLDLRTLRQLADTYDVLRACIQHLKREVASVPIRIVPKDKADKKQVTQSRIREAERFFAAGGGLGGAGGTRQQFEGALLEDLLVIGAGAVFFQIDRGGTLRAAEVIDASTIRPRVDAYGWPGPGEAWYEQWVMGLRRREFTLEELSFQGLGIHARSYTPYPTSPVEWLVGAVNSALRADDWNRTWLTDGTTPSDLIALPEGWTPGQIKEYFLFFDSLLAGDSRARQKTRFVPSGSEKVGNPTRKDQDFAEFELWLLRRTCAVMGVAPAAIGFAGEQYKVSQEGSMDSGSEFGAGVLIEHRDLLYTDILERLGYPSLKCESVTEREEPAKERGERVAALVAGGILTPNEARAEEGLDPIQGGETLFIPTTLRPLEQALEPPPDSAAPGAGGKPANGKNGGKSTNSTDTKRILGAWERKALNRLSRGQGAACEFVDEALPAEIRSQVEAGLPACATTDEVRALFACLEIATDG